MNRHVFKEDIQMGNRHIFKYSPLVTREMQIKTTVRYHFTYASMPIIKRTIKTGN